MQDLARYMIPRRVIARMEFAPGFGLVELGAVIAGAGVGYLLHLVTTPIANTLNLPSGLASFFSFVLPIAVPVAAFGLVINQEHSILNMMLRAARFNKRNKKLIYRQGSGGGGGSHVRNRSTPNMILSLFKGKAKNAQAEVGMPATVQQWLPVTDLDQGFMLRRDGGLVAAIRVEPKNLRLLSAAEQTSLLRNVHVAINALQAPAQILSISRPIDLDGYLRKLDAKLEDLPTHRQRLLRQYIRYVTDLMATGEAQERQYYILLTQPARKTAADELRLIAADLASRLNQADLDAHVMDEREMINLLHVFHNPIQAAIERPLAEPPVSTLLREEVS